MTNKIRRSYKNDQSIISQLYNQRNTPFRKLRNGSEIKVLTI